MQPVTHAVTEIQGLYGTFVFPEKLLQKIWLRGDFNRALAVAADGRRLTVFHPGKWNLLGGPDFKGARVRFDEGPDVHGDIEVHVRIADWDAHRHASDPAYDQVILHVILFPPGAGRVTRGVGGTLIPVVALLPLLHHDLEEFAADEAVETLANRAAARIPEELGGLAPDELDALLSRHAIARWEQKVHFATLRIQRLGWEEACHFTALDVLGYRYNRAPMLRVAGRWPLRRWTAGGASVDEIFASEAGQWSLQGVRPANHPKTRIKQYARWTQQRPGWPEAVVEVGRQLPPTGKWGDGTRELRRNVALGCLRSRLAGQVCGDALAGTRFDNLVCDGLLPLLAARAAGGNHAVWWHHWYAGDLPPLLLTGLRRLGVFDGQARPACHGTAQGLLGWLVARESKP